MLITTTYLEQTSADDIRPPAREPQLPAEVIRAEEPSPEFSRFLYTSVGGMWHWTRCLEWTWQQWHEHLSHPGVETWTCWVRGTPAGLAEFVPVADEEGTDVEITSFGLLPDYIGRGLGGHFLTAALRRAWSLVERWPDFPPVRRVWLHTCTLDGPHALANYQARGLRIYSTRQQDQEIPQDPPGPWPGANRPRVR